MGAGDVADGGAGDDTFILDPSDTDQGTITINGEGETVGDTLTGTGLTNLTWVTPATDDGSGSYSGSLTYENVEGETVTLTFSEIETFGGDLGPDGVVDGAATGEAMGVGYDDYQGDSIDGADGDNDSIRGNAGNDTITAGAGDDSIDGGTGNDEITGGAGADTILGSDGDDTVFVGNQFGGDVVTGGEGAESTGDVLDASAATWELNFKLDDLQGGTLSTDREDNWISSLRGSIYESFSSGGGFFGGLINWLSSYSSTSGSAGASYDGTLGFGEIEHLVGGSDRDVLDLTNITSGLTVTYSSDTSGTVSDGVNTITFTDIEEVLSTDGADTIIGSGMTSDVETFAGEGDDGFRGGKGNDRIGGGKGKDTLRGGDGDDYIDGGEGDDLLTTGTGQDTVIAGEGDDTLKNSMGDDSLVGGVGNDSLVASGGNDTLEGGAGNDTLFGGTQTTVVNGATTTGTVESDVFLWDGAGDATVVADDGAGTINDGDGAGDGFYVSSDGAATLTIDGFDALEDRVFVSEAWTGSSSSSTGVNQTTVSLTYTSGNVQTFIINHDGAGPVGTALFSVGTPTDDDSLVGGDDADTFLVQDTFGNDIIIGGEGGTDNDVIDMTAMTDAVTVTYTGDEAGTITDGTDTITFSEIEEIRLGSGNDTVAGNADSVGVNVDGGAGNDSMTGGSGDDTLLGGAGDDTLVAGNNSGAGDSLVGGAGNDVITDSYWNATLEGGDDADLFNLGFGDATISGGEGGTDQDTLSFAEANDAVNLTFSGNEAGSYTDSDGDTGTFTEIEAVEGSGQDDTINATNDSSGVEIDGGAGNDTITGGSGNDSLTGGLGADSLVGGAGDDTLSVAAGDTASGGTGDDTFVIDPSNTDGPGTITINGESETGADTLTGTGLTNFIWTAAPSDDGSGSFSGAFTYENVDGETITVNFSEIENFGGDVLANMPGVIDGTAGGDNIVQGGYVDGDGDQVTAGDDTIAAGDGADTIDAGDGNDSIEAGLGDDSIQVGQADGVDTIDGADGQDTLDFDGDGAAGVDVTLTNATDGSYAFDTSGSGTFSNVEGIWGTAQADSIDGSAAATGIDVEGQDGNDTVIGGTGDDTLDGDGGNDSLVGGAGNDQLFADGGDDTVAGGTGNDSLYAGTGADTLDGGADNDFLEVDSDDGTVTVIGGTGTDTLDFDSDGALLDDGVLATFTGAGSGNFAANGAGTSTGTFSEVEVVQGTREADTIDASLDTNGVTLDMGEGDDSVTGGSGDDNIQGDGGADTILGGAGSDTIDGGTGNDSLTGGMATTPSSTMWAMEPTRSPTSTRATPAR